MDPEERHGQSSHPDPRASSLFPSPRAGWKGFAKTFSSWNTSSLSKLEPKSSPLEKARASVKQNHHHHCHERSEKHPKADLESAAVRCINMRGTSAKTKPPVAADSLSMSITSVITVTREVAAL
jgi:hypothetical protein